MIPTLAVDALAAYRLTRLVTRDTITKRHRERIVARGGPVAELVQCSWCTGMWAAAAVVVARRTVPRAWGPVADALAMAAVVGLIAENA